MTKYEELTKLTNDLKFRLDRGTVFQENLRRGETVMAHSDEGIYFTSTIKPFRPTFSNLDACYPIMEHMNKEELALVQKAIDLHMSRVEVEYHDAQAKIDAIEELLT